MANDFYTLIVVPHAKARFRRFQVSARLLRRALWTGGVVALLSAAILAHYVRLSINSFELKRLRVENSELRTKTQQYEETTSKLRIKLGQLQSVVNKLGVMAGVEQSLPDEHVGGVGGVNSREPKVPIEPLDTSELMKMDHAVSSLTERSTQLERFYKDQKVLLASTPSIWPVRGYLSAGFGNRLDPFTGQPDFHPGIDISTPRGTRIVTPADGIVIACGLRGGYGNAVIIDHGYDVVTHFAHMDAFNVKPGQRVHRGEVIGFVGNTGRSTGPHLHYEVWVREQAQNPIHYILDEYRSFG